MKNLSNGSVGKRVMWTVMCVAMFLLLSAAVSTAGGQRAGAGEAVTIEFAVWAQPYELEMEKKYLAVFAEKYPNINVEHTTAPFRPHHEKLQVRVAGGDPPDVMTLSELAITNYVTRGVLKDLTPNFQKDNISTDIFIDAAISYMTSRGEPHAIRHKEGRIYGMPTWNSPCTLSYNIDRFRERGVTYNEKWDWPEYRATLLKLSSDDDGDGKMDKFGGPRFDGLGGAIPWSFIYANGGTWVNEDATEATINSSETVEAYQFLFDLALKDRSTPKVAEIPGLSYTQQFTTGRVATIWSHPWGLEAFKDAPFQWDVGLPPVRKGRQVVEFETVAFSVSKDTKHPEEAWTLVKFLGIDPDCLEIMLEYGVLPSTKDATITDPKMKKFQRAMGFGVAPDFIAEYPEMEDIIASEIEALFAGTKSASEAMNSAKQKIDAILD